MGNLARKVQQEQEQQQQQQQQQKIAHAPKQERFKKLWLTPGEKVLGLIFCAALSIGAFQILSTQSAIYELNKDIQDTTEQIQNQKKINNDLGMQVEELSSYERIWTKAKELGLTLNDNNVKVVQE